MSVYGTVAGFKAYHAARNTTVSASWTDAYIEALLLVASEWVDNGYRLLFSGYKTDGFLQEREWPRTSAFTNTFPSYSFSASEIPDAVVYATYEAAVREGNTQGSLQTDFITNKYVSVKVEGAVSVEYAGNVTQSSDLRLQIPVVEALLAPLVDPSSVTSSLSGALYRA